MRNVLSDLDFFDDDDDKIEPSNVRLVRHGHTVSEAEVGIRLDKLASQVFADFSRANLQKFIDNGELRVNDGVVKPKYAVKLGDVLTLEATLQDHSTALPERTELDVVYEDEVVLVVNKPVGMVVHPAVGNWTGTLVNALLYHYPSLAHLPRAGIVHRIDKDTSGLLMVAKTASAQLHLINQLKDKSVYRHYQCVVVGTLPELSACKTIDAPIARHPTARTKMAVRSNGKPAVTHIRQITPLGEQFCLLDVMLETGRTHQIRVHLSSKGHHLVGDKVYHAPLKKHLPDDVHNFVLNFPRQALHAYTLGFVHPSTGEPVEVSTPLPKDMQELIAVLKGA